MPWSLLGGVLVLATGAAALGLASHHTPTKSSPPPPADFPATGFGGYRWHGNVNEIEAEWRVPTITNTQQVGAESTWIGVQGRSADEPFIQLGTTGGVSGSAFVGTGSGTKAESSSPPSLTQTGYEVFWSDTARRFQAIPIVGLRHPGDLILFKMTRVPDGWQLSVKNLSYGWSRSVTVHYGQQDAFSQGEWTQEDPGGYTPGTDFPYAPTSTVSFQRVLVNDMVPRLHYSDETALSTQNGVYLVPTPMVNDEFSLSPPTGPALQYLSDAEQVDAGLSRLGAEVGLTGRDQGVAPANQVQDIKDMLLLYLENAHKIEAQSWPRSARPAVLRFVTTQEVFAHALSAWVTGKHHTLQQLDVIFGDPPGKRTRSIPCEGPSDSQPSDPPTSTCRRARRPEVVGRQFVAFLTLEEVGHTGSRFRPSGVDESGVPQRRVSRPIPT